MSNVLSHWSLHRYTSVHCSVWCDVGKRLYVLRQFGDGLAHHLVCGIVDQDVNPAHLLHSHIDHLLTVLFLRNVRWT